jgi:hypothetical protein
MFIIQTWDASLLVVIVCSKASPGVFLFASQAQQLVEAKVHIACIFHQSLATQGSHSILAFRMGISMFDSKNDAGLFQRVHPVDDQVRDSSGVDVPVVIIGGGPAGLFQAHLLSQLGGKSCSKSA